MIKALLMTAFACLIAGCVGYNRDVVRQYQLAVKSEAEVHLRNMPERAAIVLPTIKQFDDFLEEGQK